VKRRALALIALWAAEFESDPTLGIMEECYNNLKAKSDKICLNVPITALISGLQISNSKHLKKHLRQQLMTKFAVERRKSCSVCWKCPCRTKEGVASGLVTLLLPLLAA
jgi:hypothetical protein